MSAHKRLRAGPATVHEMAQLPASTRARPRGRPARRALALALALGLTVGLCALGPAVPAQAQLGSPLTEAERARLDEGEFVARPTTERRQGLRLIGGTSFQVLDLPPDAAWRAVQDVGQYRHMVPKVSESTLIESSGGTKFVRIRHDFGPVDATYTIRMDFHTSSQLAMFRLDESRPHDIRAGWGFFRVRPWSGGRSLLSFGIYVDPGPSLLTGVLGGTFHEWVLKIPHTFRRYVEGRGRERYAAAR